MAALAERGPQAAAATAYQAAAESYRDGYRSQQMAIELRWDGQGELGGFLLDRPKRPEAEEEGEGQGERGQARAPPQAGEAGAGEAGAGDSGGDAGADRAAPDVVRPLADYLLATWGSMVSTASEPAGGRAGGHRTSAGQRLVLRCCPAAPAAVLCTAGAERGARPALLGVTACCPAGLHPRCRPPAAVLVALEQEPPGDAPPPYSEGARPPAARPGPGWQSGSPAAALPACKNRWRCAHADRRAAPHPLAPPTHGRRPAGHALDYMNLVNSWALGSRLLDLHLAAERVRRRAAPRRAACMGGQAGALQAGAAAPPRCCCCSHRRRRRRRRRRHCRCCCCCCRCCRRRRRCRCHCCCCCASSLGRSPSHPRAGRAPRRLGLGPLRAPAPRGGRQPPPRQRAGHRARAQAGEPPPARHRCLSTCRCGRRAATLPTCMLAMLVASSCSGS